MELIEVQPHACPNCGASLTLPEAATQIRCEYCGAAFRVRREAPASAPPPATAQPAASLPTARPPTPWYRSFGWMALLFFLFTPGWAAIILWDQEQSAPAKIVAGLCLGGLVLAFVIGLLRGG